MLTFVFSPKWFYGVDVISSLIALVITFLIAGFSYKIFKFCKDKKYKYLTLSFLTLSASFFFKLLTNITVYYDVSKMSKFAGLVLKYSTLESSDLFVSIGFIGSRFLFLAGLMGLFYLLYQHRDRKLLIIMTWLILLATWFSLRNYFFYHATAILFLALLFWYYYNTCKDARRKKRKSLRYLMFTFWFLGLSQLSFIFVFMNLHMYAIAESLQLVGFLLLLINVVALFKKTRK
ncbi:hypothetical protein HOC35_00725 [Candidatus Woesearchaeota archaeon]|jgi:hypothetical protein|nr:hypothetical protein [Candidatus Woesearchaeota archaeon]